MQNFESNFAVFLGLSILFYIPSQPEPYDGGGNVMKYYGSVKQGNKIFRLTIIAGQCISACTIKLGSNNVCIDPNATLQFHQASHTGTIIKSVYDTNILMNMYPKRIQEWVRKTGALNSHELTKMTGREAIGLGIRSCWAS